MHTKIRIQLDYKAENINNFPFYNYHPYIPLRRRGAIPTEYYLA